MKSVLSVTVWLLIVAIFVVIFTALSSRMPPSRSRVPLASGTAKPGGGGGGVVDLRTGVASTRPVKATSQPVDSKPVATKPPDKKPDDKPAKKTVKNPGCTTRQLAKYKPIDTETVYHHPSLIHYAKLSSSPSPDPVSLTFMEYVALMSAHKFYRPERIMLHTYTDITGKYWDMVQNWTTPIQVNKLERVTHVGGKKLHYITHQADYVKIRTLWELGGIISDFDVIIINGTRLKEMQKISECVLSIEHHSGRYKDFINAGFNSCIKGSAFVKKWLDGYHNDYRVGWIYNAGQKPTDILISRTSKVCFNMYTVDRIAADPNWASFSRWHKPNGVDWNSKVAAHYFNKNLKALGESAAKANDPMGEMLRYVLEA